MFTSSAGAEHTAEMDLKTNNPYGPLSEHGEENTVGEAPTPPSSHRHVKSDTSSIPAAPSVTVNAEDIELDAEFIALEEEYRQEMAKTERLAKLKAMRAKVEAAKTHNAQLLALSTSLYPGTPVTVVHQPSVPINRSLLFTESIRGPALGIATPVSAATIAKRQSIAALPVRQSVQLPVMPPPCPATLGDAHHSF